MALIVTAEDNDDLRSVTERSLRRAGHTVVATPDGAAAWDAVREQRPEVVVTDVDMPRMTGLELCRAMRDDPELRSIPVLVVSGSIHPHDPQAADAGVTAVLGKPFLVSELLSRVDELLQEAPAPR